MKPMTPLNVWIENKTTLFIEIGNTQMRIEMSDEASAHDAMSELYGRKGVVMVAPDNRTTP